MIDDLPCPSSWKKERTDFEAERQSADRARQANAAIEAELLTHHAPLPLRLNCQSLQTHRAMTNIAVNDYNNELQGVAQATSFC